jgi:hypothetical protein
MEDTNTRRLSEEMQNGLMLMQVVYIGTTIL